jgi:hypothetical protein
MPDIRTAIQILPVRRNPRLGPIPSLPFVNPLNSVRKRREQSLQPPEVPVPYRGIHEYVDLRHLGFSP